MELDKTMNRALEQLKACGFKSVDIPLSQGKWTSIDIEDAPEILQYRWCAKKETSLKSSRFYARMTRRQFPRFRMHRFLLNVPAHLHTDHKDHNGLNNRRTNIRICTQQQNNFNMLSGRPNKTGFRGVKQTGTTFQAYITLNKKQIYLGSHNSATAAAGAHDAAAIKYHGKFALTNEILGKLPKK